MPHAQRNVMCRRLIRPIRHPISDVGNKVREMEALHATAALFRSHPDYAAPSHVAKKIRELIHAGTFQLLKDESDRAKGGDES